MFEVAEAAVEAALAAGARYADARVMHRRIRVDGRPQRRRRGSGRSARTPGVGVRALVGSCWGFFAVPDLTDAEARAGR